MSLGATLKVRMDTSEVNRGLRGMKSKISRAFGTIKKVGVAAFGAIAAAGGALAALTINATKFSTSVQSMAIQTGMTVHEVLSLQNAFKMVQVDSDEASGLVSEFKKRLAEAKLGTGEAVDALAKLGITVQELGSMTTMQAFTRVMDGVKDIELGSDDALFVLDKLFGGKGMELSMLAHKFNELMEQASKNTQGLADNMKDASNFDAMNMGMARLSAMARELQMRFVNALPLDRIQEMMDRVDLKGFGEKLTTELERFFEEPGATVIRWAIKAGTLIGEGIIKGIVQFLTSPEGWATIGKGALDLALAPFRAGESVLREGIKKDEEKTPAEKSKGMRFNWPLLQETLEDFHRGLRTTGDFFNPTGSSEVGEELIRQGNEANGLLRRIEGAAPSFA